MVGCYVIEFGCWWEPWGEVDPIAIIGTIGSGFFHKSGGKMASQRILSAPPLTIVVDPIGTTPMETGIGVLMVVVMILRENNGEIGTESDDFCPIIEGGCVVAGGSTRIESH